MKVTLPDRPRGLKIGLCCVFGKPHINTVMTAQVGNPRGGLNRVIKNSSPLKG